MTSTHETRRCKRQEQLALDNVQRLIEHNRADSGLDGPAVEPRPIGSVGVVGAGLMGASIAAAEVRQGVPVAITDADRRVLGQLPGRVVAELSAEMPEHRAQEQVDRLLTVTIAVGPVLRCDLVIEAIVESLPAKQKLYGELQESLSAGTMLASNTSSIPIGRLATALDDPGRFCGLHFCHPVRQRPLVEVVKGPKTSPTTVASLVHHIKSLNRMPVVVEDGPGFLINRLLLPYLSEALDLLLEGASIEEIERAAELFGMAMGPLRLLDEIGLDTTLRGGMNMVQAFPERIPSSPLLVAMVKDGRLGRKAGRGFFDYDSGPVNAVAPHPASDSFFRDRLAEWARPAEKHTQHSITMRLLLPMLLEATRVIEENKVRDARDVDLGVIFGLGFPPTRGGLLWWADSFGAARIIEMLRPMERLGSRAQATPLLRRLMQTASRFYT